MVREYLMFNTGECPNCIFITRISVSLEFLVQQKKKCRRGIQEYINETHRKQAVREERLGKQWCLLMASPICPLHLEQHGKKTMAQFIRHCTVNTLHRIILCWFYIKKAEVIILTYKLDVPHEKRHVPAHLTPSPPEASVCLEKSDLKLAEAFSSQWPHSSHSAFAGARQELTGWKWIPWFQSKGCGISKKYELECQYMKQSTTQTQATMISLFQQFLVHMLFLKLGFCEWSVQERKTTRNVLLCQHSGFSTHHMVKAALGRNKKQL